MKNICKFPNPSLHSPLSVSCFVMETDIRTMNRTVSLKEHRMILVVQGQGDFIFNDQPFRCCSGTLLFGFETETFSVNQTLDAIYLYIDFGGGRADDLFRRFHIHKGNRIFDGYDGLIPLWRDSLSRANEDIVDLASESILLYSFSRLHSHAMQYRNVVSKILEISEENFNDPELSISKIADSLSYNSKYLSYVFKKAMGVTYSEYLRDLRIKYAVSLLNEGLDSIKNVALLSGFADPLYFSNIFKKTIGISPRKYALTVQKDTTARCKMKLQ